MIIILLYLIMLIPSYHDNVVYFIRLFYHVPTRKQEAGLQGYIRIQYDHVLYVRGHIIQNVQPI